MSACGGRGVDTARGRGQGRLAALKLVVHTNPTLPCVDPNTLPKHPTGPPRRNTLPRNTLPKHATKRVIWIREPHSLAVAPPSFWRLRTGLRLGQVREPASVRPRPLDEEPKIGRVRLFVQREFRVDFALLGPRALDLIGGRDTALLPSLAMGLGPVVAFLRCRDMALLPRLTVGLGSVAAFPR
eukprot:scaffold74656_cov57-Phaeocystis_antarctica.AAC.1